MVHLVVISFNQFYHLWYKIPESFHIGNYVAKADQNGSSRDLKNLIESSHRPIVLLESGIFFRDFRYL
jgi:hypothetical protein